MDFSAMFLRLVVKTPWISIPGGNDRTSEEDGVCQRDSAWSPEFDIELCGKAAGTQPHIDQAGDGAGSPPGVPGDSSRARQAAASSERARKLILRAPLRFSLPGEGCVPLYNAP